MKILITGVKGQLGYDTFFELESRGYSQALGIDFDALDITDSKKVYDFVYGYKPDVIMHNAAYTAVDRAEDEKKTCYEVNVIGTRNLLDCAKQLNCKFLFISTDYVFDGQTDKIYEIDSMKNPQSVYGISKSHAEDLVKLYKNHYIVRIAWAFGLNGNNFVKTMLRLGKEKTEINVVSDQFGSPTYTHDLAKLLCDMVETKKYGTYHATNEGFCSWYEFAVQIFKFTNNPIKVIPVSSDMYPTKARRPANSRMSKKSLIEHGFNLLPSWQDALKRYLIELGEITE